MELTKIQAIILQNPNKALVEYGRLKNTKLETLVLGENLDSFFEQSEYFENKEMFKERKKTTSNVDLFGRLLQKEEIVFSARGGSAIYDGLTDKQTNDLNAYLDAVRSGISLREWIKSFAKKAYEVDPHGVVFIEKKTDGTNPYPTYKSIQTIYDYSFNGQKCEYICFNLTDSQLKTIGVTKKDGLKYYRFVDEVKDYIFQVENQKATELLDYTQEHGFTICPAFVISDIPYFKDINRRLSQLNLVEELAGAYLNDRSVRDLSKKKFGHQKMVEPLTKCRHCQGTGYINTNDICTHCNGTGFNSTSKIADSIKIPLEMLAENTSLDIKKIFTYIAPDIETWNKQDNSLADIEVLISDCFWGTDNRKYTTGASYQSDLKETATKTMANLQPIYSRLGRTAEWAESLEEQITTVIGKYLYPTLTDVSIKYGRDYILESTDELYAAYLDYKTKGSPIYLLNDYLERYLRSLYQNNPIELMLSLKMMEVEPLIHYTVKECKDAGYDGEVLKAKMYFSEWYADKSVDYLLATKKEQLKKDLYAFVKNYEVEDKQDVDVPEPELKNDLQ